MWLAGQQAPYEAKNLFAACPNKNRSLTGNETFIIQSNMIWNNTGKTISQVQINFANGQGFQTVTVGSPITVSYADTGYKKWTIKVILGDNSVTQCYSDYAVLRVPNTASRFETGAGQITLPAWGNITAIAGIRAAATVSVNYSKNNPTGTLRKP
jgi:hypothetical protein